MTLALHTYSKPKKDDFISEIDKCPPMVMKTPFYANSQLRLGDSIFELDLFVKWAHICYCISFFLMFCGMLHFYNIDNMLGQYCNYRGIT